MDKFVSMEIFVAVVEAGSLTAAAVDIVEEGFDAAVRIGQPGTTTGFELRRKAVEAVSHESLRGK